jgi:hypothetical protein
MLAAIIRGDRASKPLSTRKKDETEGSIPPDGRGFITTTWEKTF